MQVQELENAKRLSDDALIARLTRCVKEDRDVTARLLVHLGEVDSGCFAISDSARCSTTQFKHFTCPTPKHGSGFEPHDSDASFRPHSQWSLEAS